jgi:outer membrane autotransporter protein
VSNHTQIPGRPSALFKRSSISTLLHSSFSAAACAALLIGSSPVLAASDIVIENQSFTTTPDYYPSLQIWDGPAENRTLYIRDSDFRNCSNGPASQGRWDGGAISLLTYNRKTSDTDVTIQNTQFIGNMAKSSGGAIAIEYASLNVYVSDSEFKYNNSTWVSDLLVIRHADTEVTFRDSTSVRSTGASIGAYGDGTGVLNIISDAKNTEFTYLVDYEKKYYTGSDYIWSHTDIKLSGDNEIVNLNASDGHAVILHSGIYDTDQKYPEVNINKPDVTYRYKDKTDAGTFEWVEKTAPSGGEIRLTGPVLYTDIHSYGGTLRLLPADIDITAWWDESEKEKLGITDGSRYNNIFLKTSHLTVEGDTTLKTQDAEPITSEAKSANDEMALLEMTQNVRLQNIFLGDSLTLNGNLFIEPGVNLETAEADTYTVGDGNADIKGSGKLTVTNWIVKADRTENAEVRVSLTPDGENNLGKYFGLADSAKIAYGPIYVWNVRQTEGTSEYIFYKEKPEEALEKDEPQVLTADEPEAVPDIPHIVETPTDFNPDVYAEQVAALGTSVVQHAISNTIFGEEDAHRLEALLLDEKPERKEWWGKVIGSDLTIESKNFYDVDMYYLVAMIGHQFEPVKTSAGTFEFGAYLGAVNAREKYSVSKVQQNGAFLGGSVYWQAGGAWLGAHTNIGIMSNELTSISENRTHNPWIGVGATAGYAFPIPRYRMLVSPVVDFGYVTIRSKNYTTNLGASVKNSSLHSFEVSPGLRIDKVFDGGWKVQGEAHYVVVSKHSGKASASYADGDGVVLPRISNRNYAEYGLGIRKQDKNWGFAAKVTRSDAGHRGWAGMARVSYRF